VAHLRRDVEGTSKILRKAEARSVRRSCAQGFIPKADGRQRPLGVPAEDKIVHGAVEGADLSRNDFSIFRTGSDRRTSILRQRLSVATSADVVRLVEPVRKIEKVRFVDSIQHLDRRALDDFVFQRDREVFAAVGFG